MQHKTPKPYLLNTRQGWRVPFGIFLITLCTADIFESGGRSLSRERSLPFGKKMWAAMTSYGFPRSRSSCLALYSSALLSGVC